MDELPTSLLVNEVKKLKKEALLLKIDFEKLYNLVDRSYFAFVPDKIDFLQNEGIV